MGRRGQLSGGFFGLATTPLLPWRFSLSLWKRWLRECKGTETVGGGRRFAVSWLLHSVSFEDSTSGEEGAGQRQYRKNCQNTWRLQWCHCHYGSAASPSPTVVLTGPYVAPLSGLAPGVAYPCPCNHMRDIYLCKATSWSAMLLNVP